MIGKKVPRDAIALLRLVLYRTVSVLVCRMCPAGVNTAGPTVRGCRTGP